jgi:hypothetical protein
MFGPGHEQDAALGGEIAVVRHEGSSRREPRRAGGAPRGGFKRGEDESRGRTQPRSAALWAKAAWTSSARHRRRRGRHAVGRPGEIGEELAIETSSICPMRSSAPRIFSSSSFRAGVAKRSALARDCRRIHSEGTGHGGRRRPRASSRRPGCSARGASRSRTVGALPPRSRGGRPARPSAAGGARRAPGPPRRG